MKKFIRFILIWISQQLAIPFWMVGHIHLSFNWDVYSDVKILFASIGMNVLVAIGFWLDWKQYSANKIDHTSNCLLYTSPSPRDRQKSRMPSSA